MRYEIKINLDRKNRSQVCKNNSRPIVKGNVTNAFILTSDKSLKMIKIKKYLQLINNPHESFNIY